jgi:hypothetical protein
MRESYTVSRTTSPDQTLHRTASGACAPLLVALFFAGCNADPPAGTYTTKRPDEESLAGTYGFVGDTISPREPECRLVLSSDGTFSLTNYPALSLPESSQLRFGGLTTATGQWRIGGCRPSQRQRPFHTCLGCRSLSSTALELLVRGLNRRASALRHSLSTRWLG